MKKKLVALTLATAMAVTSLTIPGGAESTNEELVNAGTYTVDVEISNATSWGKALRGNYTSDYLYLGTVTVNRANAENLTVKSDGRGNLTAGNKLKIVKINKKGEQVLFNATTYKVGEDGSLLFMWSGPLKHAAKQGKKATPKQQKEKLLILQLSLLMQIYKITGKATKAHAVIQLAGAVDAAQQQPSYERSPHPYMDALLPGRTQGIGLQGAFDLL